MADYDNDSAEYKVGYKCPPKHTQFKKGQSGNPKGRGKKKSATDLDVHAILNESQKVSIKGKKIEISGSEVVFRSALNRALKHDKIRDLIRVIHSFEEHGCLTRPEVEERHGVLEIPYDMADGDLNGAANKLIEEGIEEGVGPKEMSRRHIARRDAADSDVPIENEVGVYDSPDNQTPVHFIRKIADEHHAIEIDGKPRSVPTAELILKKLHQLAVRGHAHAIKERDRLIQKYNPTPDSDSRFGYLVVPETMPVELFRKMMEEENARKPEPPTMENYRKEGKSPETE